MVTQNANGRRTAKIIDFDRAQLVQGAEGNFPRGLGPNCSIYCAAPEQLTNDQVDQRTDLYSLGCVFYQCLCGQRPFNGDQVMAVMASHLQHFVTPLSEVDSRIPHWLCDWVMSLISLKKEDRPGSVELALENLLQATSHRSVTKQSA